VIDVDVKTPKIKANADVDVKTPKVKGEMQKHQYL